MRPVFLNSDFKLNFIVSKKFLIIIAILGCGIAAFYAYLGGFNKPKITVVTSKPLYVAGKYYEGPADDKAFGKIFEEIGRAVEDKTLAGTLTNIYYNNPEVQTDIIKAFVGVAIKDTTARLPAGYKIRTMPGDRKVIQVTTNAHFLLAPNKIYPALFEHVKEKNIQVEPPYLEQFPKKDFAILQVEIR